MFKGYKEFFFQDLIIKKRAVIYKMARYQKPDGTYICAKLPPETGGGHFGPQLKSYVIALMSAGNMTQQKIHEHLLSLEIQISAGEINNIISGVADTLDEECEDVFTAGITTAQELRADDTGARHKGKNGVCTVIQNDFFAYFSSTNSKSRTNFLTILRGRRNTNFVLNGVAVDYINRFEPKSEIVAFLEKNAGVQCTSEEAWNKLLADHNINAETTGKNTLKIVKEGALLGAAIANGLSINAIILSDGAQQFKILLHALCWIHAERIFKKIIPSNDAEKQELDRIASDVWVFYKQLKEFKQNPNPDQKDYFSAEFDRIFTRPFVSDQISMALALTRQKKDELLLVLDYPFIDLHNNTTESAIRTYVTKRKISGSTRSDAGRRARDIITSLDKTCRKYGISLFHFLSDRLSKRNQIPYLPDLIRQKASSSKLSPPTTSA